MLDSVTQTRSRGSRPDSPADRARLERVSRRHPRDRAAHSEGRAAVGERTRTFPTRRSARPRRSRSNQADVRSAGARLAGRDHAHLDADVRQRTSGAVYPSSGIRDGFHSASHHSNARANDGLVRADQPLSRPDAGLLPRQAAGDARRRRHAARSLGGAVRQQHEQRQPARSRSAADRRGRRRLGRAEGRPPHLAPAHTPMSNLLLALLDKLGVHQDSFGDSTAKLEI